MQKLPLRNLQLIQLEALRLIDDICTRNDISYYLIAGSCLGAVRHKGFIPWDDDIDLGMMRPDYEKFITLFDKYFDSSAYFLQNYASELNFAPALSRICIKGTYVDIPSLRDIKCCRNSYIDLFPLDNVPDDNHAREVHRTNLHRIDRLLQLKLYNLYRNSTLERVAKRTLSLCLSVIPLKVLQKKREAEMRRFESDDTQCVSSTASKYGYKKQIMPKTIYGVPKRIWFETLQVCVPERTDEYLKLLYGKNYMQLPPKEQRIKPNDAYLL